MSKEEEPRLTEKQTAFTREVGAKEQRKLKARRQSGRSIWLGLGAIGVIGWSVALPVLLGIALGMWLDRRHPGRHSWTLALLVAGLLIGCWIAWGWVAKEHSEIRKE